MKVGEAFMSGAAGQKRVPTDFISDFPLASPGLDEQTSIANYLDRTTSEIDALIAQKERLIALYEEEKNAIINQAVTKGIDSNVGVPLVGTPNNDTEQGNHKGLPYGIPASTGWARFLRSGMLRS